MALPSSAAFTELEGFTVLSVPALGQGQQGQVLQQTCIATASEFLRAAAVLSNTG